MEVHAWSIGLIVLHELWDVAVVPSGGVPMFFAKPFGLVRAENLVHVMRSGGIR